MLLEINSLTKYFGGLAAVSKFEMNINKGDIVGLIGPNGAGKTTLFNIITGIHKPTHGKITFSGEDITGKKSHVIAKLGIGRTFQLNPLFPDFTVLQNVIASFYLHPKSNLFDIYFNTSKYVLHEKQILNLSLEILRLVGIYDIKDELAKNIPHGHQKMLGIARALAIKPILLMLDEPFGGMNPAEIETTMQAIRKTHQQGVTILVVEHNMKVLELCNKVVVMNFGYKIAEGLPEEIRANKDVIQAYFGEAQSA